MIYVPSTKDLAMAEANLAVMQGSLPQRHTRKYASWCIRDYKGMDAEARRDIMDYYLLVWKQMQEEAFMALKDEVDRKDLETKLGMKLQPFSLIEPSSQ